MLEILPALWPPDDFVEYWAAGRLNALGENPYDPDLLIDLERRAGRDTDEAIMMWNPPWTLPLAMPFGLLSPRIAQILWLAMNILFVLVASARLWTLSGGRTDRQSVAWAIGMLFIPTLFVLQAGQIGAVLLFGWVGVLHFLKAGRPGLAGACTLLPAIKPHLFLIIWAAMAIWAISGRRWRFMFGAILACAAATGIAWLCNPQVIAHYLDALGNRPPAQWQSPTFGTCLRIAFGEEMFRLQFIPPLVGLIWLAGYGYRLRQDWDWGRQLPVLLLVSMVTAPYGAWPFDMVVLLLPIVQIAATPDRNRIPWLVAFLAIEAALLAQNVCGVSSFWFLWLAPVVMLAHAIWMTTAPSRPEPQS